MYLRVFLIFFIVAVSLNSHARSSMYTWKELKEDSNVVIFGYVQAAKIINYDDIEASFMEPNIELEVTIDEVYFDSSTYLRPSKTITVFLDNGRNPVTVGSYGFFFLTCDVKCKGVDSQFSAWPITQVWVQKEVDSRNNIEVIDFKNLVVGHIPNVLWTEHNEETFDGLASEFSSKKFIMVKTLKAQLRDLLNGK